MKIADRYDQVLPGLLLGLMVPVIAFVISWLILSDISLAEYFQRYRKFGQIPSMISLSAIPNLLLFFIFLWKNMYRAARGVIFATLILGFVMLIFKFI